MAVMNRNDVNRKTWYLLILMPIIYLAVSVLVVFLVKNNGAYPTGSDTMYHIFRGDYVYNSIKVAGSGGVCYTCVMGTWKSKNRHKYPSVQKVCSLSVSIYLIMTLCF